MPTWKEARIQVTIASLFLDWFLVSLAGRENTSGWLVILTDSLLTADLNNFWNLKTKTGIRRPQEEGMTFKKYIYEIKRARGESMTSGINRSDEALMDMRKKLATAPVANSSESTMIPPQIQGWLLLHRSRFRDQDIVGVMTMTGGSLNTKLVEKSLLDLFTEDVLQSVDRSHGEDSGNPRKQHAY